MEERKTQPYNDQCPGTSGLRKKVVQFQKDNYLENFIQSTFDSLNPEELVGSLVVGGDGRFFCEEAGHTILRIAAANGVGKVYIPVNFLVSTPAVSTAIRHLGSFGGIIMTASHNPGGPKADFGVKYNISSGGPAPAAVTNKIYAKSKEITHFKIWKEPADLDISKVGATTKLGNMVVEVFDATELYTKQMASLFDFVALRKFVKRSDFKMVFDGMNGVIGPFAKSVLVEALGVSADSLVQCVPKKDFGGLHPDPNLTYARHLAEKMGVMKLGEEKEEEVPPDFGAAADGDGDRNMILGARFFVTPSDSVAVIAHYAQQAIPYFKTGLKGVARSMPTSRALDRVAAKLDVPLFEVPTGWKFFGNLMDTNQLSICGEESFGTGSDHIREKDGLWAVLAWLSILEFKNRGRKEGELCSVKEIVHQFWRDYGRNFYTRYDYEGVDASSASRLMESMQREMGEELKKGMKMGEFVLEKADSFCYTDATDGSVAKNQGLRFLFTDGSRFVFRLSGTGSVGATVRLYVEKYESEVKNLFKPTQEVVKPLIREALRVSKLEAMIGRSNPSVIT